MPVNLSRLKLAIFLVGLIVFFVGVALRKDGVNGPSMTNIVAISMFALSLFLNINRVLSFKYLERPTVHVLLVIFALFYLNGLDSYENYGSYVNILRLFIVFYTGYFVSTYLQLLSNKELFYISLLILLIAIFYLVKSLIMDYARLTFIGQANATAQVFYVLILINNMVLFLVRRYRLINHLSLLLLIYLVIETGSRTIIFIIPIFMVFIYCNLKRCNSLRKIFFSKYTLFFFGALVVLSLSHLYGFINLESKRFATYLTYVMMFHIDLDMNHLFNGFGSEQIETFFSDRGLEHSHYIVPHNSIIIILVRSGAFAAATYLVLHLYMIHKVICYHNQHWRTRLSAFTVSAAISCFVIGLAENSFVEVGHPYTYLFYIVVAFYFSNHVQRLRKLTGTVNRLKM